MMASGKTTRVQPWTLIRGMAPSPFVQSEDDYTEVSGFADATFLIDVSNVTPPAGASVVLNLESSPSMDDAYFQPVTNPITISGATTTPLLVKTVSSLVTNTQLARYLRVRVTTIGGTGAYDLCFRVQIVGSRRSFFVPTQVPGCALWLRPDLGVALGGSRVRAWADQSGTGDSNKNVTQNVGGHQPTLIASDPAYNNRPTLTFSSARADFLGSAAWVNALPQPFTTIVVGNDDGTGSEQVFHDIQSGGVAEVVIASTDGTHNFYSILAGAWFNSAVAPSSSPKVLSGLFNGASSSVWVNAVTPSATGNAGANQLTGLSVGGAANGLINLNGKIAEVIVYNRALSVGERRQLFTYLGMQYGISIGA